MRLGLGGAKHPCVFGVLSLCRKRTGKPAQTNLLECSWQGLMAQQWWGVGNRHSRLQSCLPQRCTSVASRSVTWRRLHDKKPCMASPLHSMTTWLDIRNITFYIKTSLCWEQQCVFEIILGLSTTSTVQQILETHFQNLEDSFSKNPLMSSAIASAILSDDHLTYANSHIKNSKNAARLETQRQKNERKIWNKTF